MDKLNSWRDDIQEDITEIDWNDAWLKAQTQTINTWFKLLQYKWLMMMYMTPVKLHQMSGNILDICTKCLNKKGTLLHCLWECPKIQKFWNDVINCLSEVFHINSPLNPKLWVFGIYTRNFTQTQKQTKIPDFGLLQARRVIALYRKSMEAPSMKKWIKELSECIGLERLTYC